MIGFDEGKKEGSFFVEDQCVDVVPFGEETFEAGQDNFPIMPDGLKEGGLPT